MHLVALATHWGPGGQKGSKSCGRLLGSSNFWAGRAPALMTDNGHDKRCPSAFLGSVSDAIIGSFIPHDSRFSGSPSNAIIHVS